MMFFQTNNKNGLACKANPWKKRETGLEPATACLEGRLLQDHRSLGISCLPRRCEQELLDFTHP